MNLGLQALVDLLDLEPIEVNIFRGTSPDEKSQAVEVKDYSLDHLAGLIHRLARKEAAVAHEVRLCTNDEYCLELCGAP
jgi:hypothetical protein